MSAPRFVITTTFEGRRQTRTWDSTEPLMLGHGVRASGGGPLWILERTLSGQVRVRSLGRRENEAVSARSRVLAEVALENGAKVELRDESELDLEIKAVRLLHPVIYRSTDTASLGRGFQVYECMGDWNTQLTRHDSQYRGSLHGQELFSVQTSAEGARIQPLADGLALEIDGKLQSIAGLAEIELKPAEFLRSSLRLGHASWYFSAISDAAKSAAYERAEVDPSGRHFKRVLIGAMLFLCLTLAIGPFLPKPSEDDIIPAQIVKVLIQKPKVGKKLDLPGAKKKDDEKALAKSQETAPTKPNELIVPKGGSPGKQLSKQAQARISKVQNLLAGVMRGGLSKIADSKQLAENSRLGAGGAVKSNMGAMTSAMSAVNVNVNVGAGTGNAKVAGFGGDANAGAKGSAIGYSDGVGKTMSGTGATQISLGTTDADVEEGLTKEEVGKVIHEHMKEVRYCYESSMVRASKVDGKINVNFTINAQGRVAAVSQGSSTVSDSSLSECIMRRLKTWPFPHPKGGVTVDVSYPFIFKTLGE